MFAYIKGEIVSVNVDSVVIDNNGLGYLVYVSTTTLSELKKGDIVKLLIYNSINEGEWRFYGFTSDLEKIMFEKLITVQSIGPKMGMQILSGMTHENLAVAIASSDEKSLSSIKGIGKKTAQRIIVELREKMQDDVSGHTIVNLPTEVVADDQAKQNIQDAIEGLVGLGISLNEAQNAVLKASTFTTKVDELIRLALRTFASK